MGQTILVGPPVKQSAIDDAPSCQDGFSDDASAIWSGGGVSDWQLSCLWADLMSSTLAVALDAPLSSSAPLFIGGMVRWLVDKRNGKLAQNAQQTVEEKQAAGDRSPGVLLASGYIAGGALAGIVIAFTSGILTGFDQAMESWAEKSNPFFAGLGADALSLLPYAVIVLLLYWVGREKKARARML